MRTLRITPEDGASKHVHAVGQAFATSYDGPMAAQPSSRRTRGTPRRSRDTAGPERGRLASRVIRIIVVLAIVAGASYFGIDLTGSGNGPASPAQTDTRAAGGSIASTDRGHDRIAELMLARQSDTMVTLTARIVRILPTDTDGSRHQKFIVGIESSKAPKDTVLIAHNIDLAPEVPASLGDTLTIRGEYEYNDLGGVIHWTHHDPKQWREGGWIEHKGRRYE